MKSPYDRRLARAARLGRSDLLDFYSALATIQKDIFDQLDSSDLYDLIPFFPALLETADRFAPPLAAFAREHLSTSGSIETILTERWQGDPASLDPRAQFFAHALLEPFAMRLSQRGEIDPHWTESSCPF